MLQIRKYLFYWRIGRMFGCVALQNALQKSTRRELIDTNCNELLKSSNILNSL